MNNENKEKKKDRIDKTIILRAQFGSIHLTTDCQFNFSFYYIDTDEIPGFFLLLKNHIFIARSEDTIFIFHV